MRTLTFLLSIFCLVSLAQPPKKPMSDLLLPPQPALPTAPPKMVETEKKQNLPNTPKACKLSSDCEPGEFCSPERNCLKQGATNPMPGAAVPPPPPR